MCSVRRGGAPDDPMSLAIEEGHLSLQPRRTCFCSSQRLEYSLRLTEIVPIHTCDPQHPESLRVARQDLLGEVAIRQARIEPLQLFFVFRRVWRSERSRERRSELGERPDRQCDEGRKLADHNKGVPQAAVFPQLESNLRRRLLPEAPDSGNLAAQPYRLIGFDPTVRGLSAVRCHAQKQNQTGTL